MSIFERIFTRLPSYLEIKRLIDDVEENNQLYKSLMGQLFPGAILSKDTKIRDYIKDGYEKNADVFSVIDRLSTMYSRVPIVVKDSKDDEVTEGPLYDLYKQPNNYQIWQEYAKLSYTFYLATGNDITYAPLLTAGNDRGKLMPGGMYIMPTQHVEIISGGWRDPVKEYILDIDQTEKIPAENVMHIRMPNLQYEGGANFMGMSPIKVAVLIIEAQNQGYQTVADTLARGIPPGILTKVNEEYDVKNTKEQQSNLERLYKQKYGNQKYGRHAGTPVLSAGDIRWVPMGFSNFRDLQILEMSEHGLRVLCNILGVPSQAFNDPKASTLANMGDARRMVYTNRLIPDLELKTAHLNARFSKAYNGQTIEPDWSNIPELQEDKVKLSQWLSIAVDKGLPPNVMIEKLGLERIDNPAMDRSYAPFNLVPIEEIGMDPISVEEAAKILKSNGIDDYKGLKAV